MRVLTHFVDPLSSLKSFFTALIFGRVNKLHNRKVCGIQT